MTLEEVQKIIKNNLGDFSQFVYGDICKGSEINKFKLISSERDNSDYIVIFQVDNNYFKLIGYYDSWDGSSFDNYEDLTEVKPVEKMVTIYEEV